MKAGVVTADGARTSSQLPTPGIKSRVFVFQTATKVTLFYIYLAGAAERKENGFKGRERQRGGEKKYIIDEFACWSCQTFLLHSDIYKVEEGLRAPAFPDSPNENRQSN